MAVLLFSWVATLVVVAPASARDGPEYPKPLDPGIYISDRAVVLTIGDVTRLNKAAAEIFETSGVPVVVVTIKSVEDMGGDPAGGIEKYAKDLFNHWGIGSAKDNRGVLLLLSSGDRKARIQLGSAWPPSQDAVTQKIMDTSIVPAIKRGAIAQGLIAGVTDLGAMIAESEAARKGAAPATSSAPAAPVPYIPPPPSAVAWLSPVFWCGGVVIALVVVFGIVRAFIRRGSGSTAAGLGYGSSTGMHDAWSGGHSYGGGGGHSGGDSGGGGGGGSDGGGSSSGGGSTGSW